MVFEETKKQNKNNEKYNSPISTSSLQLWHSRWCRAAQLTINRRIVLQVRHVLLVNADDQIGTRRESSRAGI